MSGFARRQALALALGVAAFALYMVAAGRSYDYDSSETVGAFVATHSLLDPLRRQIAFNNHPLFSLLEHLVYSAGGRSETALRMLPCAFGAATIAVLASWLARRSLLAGASAGLLLAADPLFATESRSVRGYSLLTLCAVSSTLLLVRRLERRDRRTDLAYVLALAAAVATHLYALLVVAGQIGAVAGAGKLGRGWLLRWGAALTLGGSIYIGLARTMLEAGRGERGHFDPRFPAEAARALLGVRPLAVVLFAVLALLGLVALRRRAATGAAAGVAAALVLDWAVYAPLDLHPRYLIWIAPACAGLAGAAAARWRPTLILAAVAIAVMGGLDAQHWSTPTLPSRQIAELVSLLRARHERVCALPYTRGALMAYGQAPPEITQRSQLHQCDALVAIATDPRRLLTAARARFPDAEELPALTPMLVLSKQNFFAGLPQRKKFPQPRSTRLRSTTTASTGRPTLRRPVASRTLARTERIARADGQLAEVPDPGSAPRPPLAVMKAEEVEGAPRGAMRREMRHQR